MAKINKFDLINQEKLAKTQTNALNVIQRIEYSPQLLNMMETINFYSAELSATVEYRSFFKSLSEHYHLLKTKQEEIISVLKREIE